MATQEVFKQQMDRLAAAYPNMKVNPAMMTEYFRHCDVLLPEYFEAGITSIITSSKYFPTLSEIIIAHEQAMLSTLEAKHGKGNANRLVE